MKKILSLVVLMAVISATALASGGANINPVVEKTFSKTFSGAQHVSWTVMTEEKIHRASFLLNNERVNAFFDVDGNLIATGRFIKTDDLSPMVRRNIESKFPESRILEVIEYVETNLTSYLVTFETAKAVITVRANGMGTSQILKKEKK